MNQPAINFASLVGRVEVVPVERLLDELRAAEGLGDPIRIVWRYWSRMRSLFDAGQFSAAGTLWFKLEPELFKLRLGEVLTTELLAFVGRFYLDAHADYARAKETLETAAATTATLADRFANPQDRLDSTRYSEEFLWNTSEIGWMIQALDAAAFDEKCALDYPSEWLYQRLLSIRVSVCEGLMRCCVAADDLPAAMSTLDSVVGWIVDDLVAVPGSTKNLAALLPRLVEYPLWPEVRRALWQLAVAAGDAYCETAKRSNQPRLASQGLALYESAQAFWAEDDADDEECANRLHIAIGSALEILGEYDQAASMYDGLAEELGRSGHWEMQLRMRLRHTAARWFGAHTLVPLSEVWQLMLAAEIAIGDLDFHGRAPFKAEVHDAACTLLVSIAGDDELVLGQDEGYQVLSALELLREPAFIVHEESPPTYLSREDLAFALEHDGSHLHPLACAAPYLDQSVFDAVVYLQKGWDRFYFVTLDVHHRDGRAVSVERVSDSFLDAQSRFEEVLENARVFEAMGGGGVDLAIQLEAAAIAVYSALPPTIRSVIESARYVVQISDSTGEWSGFSLDQLHDGSRWLGLKVCVTRSRSLTSLIRDVLAPNAVPSVTHATALVLDASPQGTSLLALPGAASEVKSVVHSLNVLGLEATAVQGNRQNLVSSFCSGHQVVHYAGHGNADRSTEGLVSSDNEKLDRYIFSMLPKYQVGTVYLSACDVGGIRGGGGGRQLGIATQLVSMGAPVVLAATSEFPDNAAMAQAKQFYRAASDVGAGAALVASRRTLAENHLTVASWSCLTMFGDPLASILGRAGELRGSRTRQVNWTSYITRWFATRDDDDRQRCLNELVRPNQAGSIGARRQLHGYLSSVADWNFCSRRVFEHLLREFEGNDPKGYAVLKLLSAMLKMKELVHLLPGTTAASVLFDPIAYAVLIAEGRQMAAKGVELCECAAALTDLTEDALSIAEGWARADTRFERLVALLK